MEKVICIRSYFAVGNDEINFIKNEKYYYLPGTKYEMRNGCYGHVKSQDSKIVESFSYEGFAKHFMKMKDFRENRINEILK